MTTLEMLLAKDWSDKTPAEIAGEIGRTTNTVRTTIRRYKEKTGIDIPYKQPERIIDKILAMDCRDMTPAEIAKELGEVQDSVETALYVYKKRSGEEVPHKKSERVWPIPGTLLYDLLGDDWSDLTVAQIAEVMGTTPRHVRTVMRAYKKRTGEEIPHAKGNAKRSKRKKSITAAPTVAGKLTPQGSGQPARCTSKQQAISIGSSFLIWRVWYCMTNTVSGGKDCWSFTKRWMRLRHNSIPCWTAGTRVATSGTSWTAGTRVATSGTSWTAGTRVATSGTSWTECSGRFGATTWNRLKSGTTGSKISFREG